MKKENNLLLYAVLCLSIGLAPWFPEPHIWGKIKWIAGGAIGMKAMDYFDLIFHGTPWVLLFWVLVKSLLMKKK